MSVPILVVGLMVKLTSKGPMLYWSDRAGIRGKRKEERGDRTGDRGQMSDNGGQMTEVSGRNGGRSYESALLC